MGERQGGRAGAAGGASFAGNFADSSAATGGLLLGLRSATVAAAEAAELLLVAGAEDWKAKASTVLPPADLEASEAAGAARALALSSCSRCSMEVALAAAGACG